MILQPSIILRRLPSQVSAAAAVMSSSFASTSHSSPSQQQQQQQQKQIYKPKKIVFVRHGQATHNPRAEEAKANGCSHDTFLKLMQEDDQFDAELTLLGIDQAKASRQKNRHLLLDVDLVVSSPLSRALKTADLTICPEQGIDRHDESSRRHPKRICYEEWREINGWLLNAKRRTKTELKQLFHPRWDFDSLVEKDETWTEEMETYDDCGERGYQSLLWLLRRSEDKILVVSHGGILRFSMVDHPLVKLLDGREPNKKRFDNCEMREYEISYDLNNTEKDDNGDERPVVVLTEVGHTRT